MALMPPAAAAAATFHNNISLAGLPAAPTFYNNRSLARHYLAAEQRHPTINSCPVPRSAIVRKLEYISSFDVHHECCSSESLESSYHTLLSACEERKSSYQAHLLHSQIISCGLDCIPSLGERLVSIFVKCGDIAEAVHVFHMLPQRTAFSWTVLISAYVVSGKEDIALSLYKLMQDDGIQPSKFTCLSILKACGNLNNLLFGKDVHENVRKSGFCDDLFIGSALVNMYCKCGDLFTAENVFRSLPQCDLVSCSAMFSGYVEFEQEEKAIKLYRQMIAEGLKADQKLILLVIRACCILAEKYESSQVERHTFKTRSLEIGKALHADLLKMGLSVNLFVGSTLVRLYGKCGDIQSAKYVFDNLSQRDAILWTTMLSAYIHEGQTENTLRLFREIHEAGVKPDEQIFVIAVQACSVLADVEDTENNQLTQEMIVELGQALHRDIQNTGFNLRIFVGSALITMYGRCGKIQEAEKVFHNLPFRDSIVWNAMITAYVENDEGEMALHLYKQMCEEGVPCNECTFVVALQACCALVAKEETNEAIKTKILEIGQALHLDAHRYQFTSNVLVVSTLITMYSKCGSLLDAEKVFYAFSGNNVVICNPMLAAYVDHGQGEKASTMYEEMVDKHVLIDDMTLLHVLRACSETGNVTVCKQIHFTMVSSLTKISLPLATTLIHAYGSCANMADAQAVFSQINQRDVACWNALISGYAQAGDCLGTLENFEKMCKSGIRPNGLSFLPVLSVCCHAGLVDEGMSYFKTMIKDYGINPTVEHYANIMDLLVRAGNLTNVVDMFSRMPVEPDLVMWSCLLNACKKHGDAKLAREAFQQALNLKPNDAAMFVLMSNIHSDFGELTEE